MNEENKQTLDDEELDEVNGGVDSKVRKYGKKVAGAIGGEMTEEKTVVMSGNSSAAATAGEKTRVVFKK